MPTSPAAQHRNGGFDLLDVIDFYLVKGDKNREGTLPDEFTGTLQKTETSEAYYIKGVMKTIANTNDVWEKVPNSWSLVSARENAKLTITGGAYDGGKGGNNVCVWAGDGAKVTIKGGTFTVGGDASGNGNSVIESNGGNIVIEGGFFYTDYAYRNFYYVLNQQNGNPGTITVKGGTFVNYDPSKGDDNLGGNFVAEGYKVVSEAQANGDTWYTVVAK